MTVIGYKTYDWIQNEHKKYNLQKKKTIGTIRLNVEGLISKLKIRWSKKNGAKNMVGIQTMNPRCENIKAGKAHKPKNSNECS